MTKKDSGRQSIRRVMPPYPHKNEALAWRITPYYLKGKAKALAFTPTIHIKPRHYVNQKEVKIVVKKKEKLALATQKKAKKRHLTMAAATRFLATRGVAAKDYATPADVRAATISLILREHPHLAFTSTGAKATESQIFQGALELEFRGVEQR